MSNALLSWEVAGQVIVILGTGGWLAYVIKDHGKRLAAIEQAVETRASAGDVEALEERMPEQLQMRLRTLEFEKLNTNDHAAYCAASLKTVEVMVESIEETVESHAQRASSAYVGDTSRAAIRDAKSIAAQRSFTSGLSISDMILGRITASPPRTSHQEKRPRTARRCRRD